VERALPRPGGVGGERRESWRGEPYAVRSVSGSPAGKTYRCPGCDQLIRAAVPHVVAWPADAPDAEDRRHWHATCWAARHTRSPVLLRGRGAPRY
jgi:hypothetical protein